MDGAIWAILYDLGKEHRAEYLDWFHDIHIPEKLGRPGYVFAGHYAVVGTDGRATSVTGGDAADGGAGHIALFGGVDTSVFLNPSPAQIKPKQTELTRTMMGHRSNSRSFIAALEWQARAEAASGVRSDGAIVLSCLDTPGADEDFGAWCVQDLKPMLVEAAGFASISKYLTTVGPMKHALLSAFQSVGAAVEADSITAQSDWSRRVSQYQTHQTGSPLIARRIWPAD